MAKYRTAVLLALICSISLFCGISSADAGIPYVSSDVLPDITLFIPSSNMIHSDKIMDEINTPQKDVLFATTQGLSLYNGTWSTRHINRDNISEGLIDDFVTAIEYDSSGNLWIGYSAGIQIYNGIYYRTIRDQQLLKALRINDLQRWDNDMWVATGNSGVHRYHDGTWTWFQPMSTGGPGFYEVRSMAIDPIENILVFTTVKNGLWIARKSADNKITFEQIAQKDSTYAPAEEVTRDPRGGVYFFNDTTVTHYSEDTGFRPALSVSDLTKEQVMINDLAAASDGKLYIATDNGIYVWGHNGVYYHLSRFEGIGTSEIVRTIFIDAQNRVWFSTHGYVGFFPEDSASDAPIAIDLVTIEPTVPEPTVTVPAVIRTASQPEPDTGDKGISTGGLAPILDPIIRAINSILAKLGLAQAPQ